MSTPVPELIALELVSRLENINECDGYSFTVSEVVRPSRKGETWTHQHLGIGVLQGESTRLEDLDYPGNPPAIAYSIDFQLQCICRDSATSIDDPKPAHAATENEVAAAVVKAITATGAATWHTIGGNAIDARFGSMQPLVSPEGEQNGVMIPLAIIYRVSETDPFTTR